MKAIAYNIQPHEKELLTLANGKRHDLTLISNELNDKTVIFAQGKEVVTIAVAASLNSAMLVLLQKAGVKKIIVRSAVPISVSTEADADRTGLRVVYTPADSVAQIAQKTIDYLNKWEEEKRAATEKEIYGTS